MSILRIIFLIAAVIGAIVPWSYLLIFTGEHGFDPAAILAATTINDVATGTFSDLVISAIVLMIWIIAETAVRRDYWVAPVCIAATFLIGVSCGLPLYLFLRSRPRG